MQADGSVQNQNVIAVLFGMLNCVFGNLNNVFFAFHFKHRHAGALADNLQLSNSCRAVYITRRKQRALILLFKIVRKLATVCSLTRALQAYHHYNGWGRRGNGNLAYLAAHNLSKLFPYNLNNLLRRGKALQHITANTACTYVVYKSFYYFKAYIRLQQRKLNFTHCLAFEKALQMPLVTPFHYTFQ